MKKLSLGLSMLALLPFTINSVNAAAVSLTGSDAAGATSFNAAGKWSDAAAPSSLNTYSVGAGLSLRSAIGANALTFAGASLSLSGTSASHAIFVIKTDTNQTTTVNNLTLDGGEIQNGANSAGTASTVTLAGNGITLGTTNGGGFLTANGGAGGGRILIVSAPISGASANLTILGGNAAQVGTVVLTGTNTYTGATTINTAGGVLQLGNAGTTGSLSSSSSITNNGTLIFNRSNAVTQGTDFGTISAGTGAVSQLGGGTLTLNTANTYGTTAIGASNGTSVIRATASGALGTGAVSILGNGGTNRLELTSGVTLGNAFIFSGRTLVTTGPAIQNISGNNTLSGLISFTTGGNYYNIQSDAGTLAITNTGTLTFQDANRVFTLQGAGDGSVATVVAGLGALSKAGAGTWTLSGANTYTGTTSISAGTLLINGSSAAGSAVTLSGTGVLGGTGTVNGTVAVGSGTALQGGSSAAASGSLTLSNNVSLNDGSIIKLTLGASFAHSSLVRTGGTWTFDSDQAFTFTNLGATSGTYDNIISGLASDPGTTGTWTITNSGYLGTFLYDGAGGVDVTFMAVPEPREWGMMLGATLVVLAVARRRRMARA